MSSFKDLLSRVLIINEAKVSPYASAHPSFGGITSKMKAGGLSSAPLDTIKFIREVLYLLDIIDDEENNNLKRAAGFTGKKQAMLSILRAKQQDINSKTQEIADQVSSTLDDFINGVGVNRSREEKYAAQAAAQEIASQIRQSKSGKNMDDALTDIISDETILVKASVAKILFGIQKNLGEPGFDIDVEALTDVIDYSDKINSLDTLKSFIKQISSEPGYEKIAAYLSSAVKPISAGTEDEEMEEAAEDEYDSVKGDMIEEESKVERVKDYTVHFGANGEVKKVDHSDRSAHVDPALVNKYLKEGFPLSRACAAATSYPNDPNPLHDEAGMLGESYTSTYIIEQKRKDSYYTEKQEVSQSFKERYKPKTSWQLEELRRYGM